MKKYIVPIISILLLVVFIGCGPKVPVGPRAVFKGTVTHGRGGPPIEGMEIYGMVGDEKFEAITTGAGYFEISVPAEVTFDLIGEKEGYGGLRVQDLYFEEDESLYLDLFCMPYIDPELPIGSSRLSITGIERDDVLTGEVDLWITLGDSEIMALTYVSVGSYNRIPHITRFWSVETEVAAGTLDTRAFPNGESFLQVIVYDKNSNVTFSWFPVVIENEVEDAEVPGKLGDLIIMGMTYGQNTGYWSAGRQALYNELGIDDDPFLVEFEGGTSVDLRGIPSDRVYFNALQWFPIENARGYRVYRSTDDVDYEYLGTVMQTHSPTALGQYQDYDSALTHDVVYYYEVVPFNTKGDGESLKRSISLLPPYNVMLTSPGSYETDVPLQPTFTWDTGGVEFDSNTSFSNTVVLHEATAGLVWQDTVANCLSAEMPFELDPGTVYSWDITYSAARRTWEQDDFGSARASSFSGIFQWGSINGEFIFTTTLETDCG